MSNRIGPRFRDRVMLAWQALVGDRDRIRAASRVTRYPPLLRARFDEISGAIHDSDFVTARRQLIALERVIGSDPELALYRWVIDDECRDGADE